jgi:hypothetical protein
MCPRDGRPSISTAPCSLIMMTDTALANQRKPGTVLWSHTSLKEIPQCLSTVRAATARGHASAPAGVSQLQHARGVGAMRMHIGQPSEFRLVGRQNNRA